MGKFGENFGVRRTQFCQQGCSTRCASRRLRFPISTPAHTIYILKYIFPFPFSIFQNDMRLHLLFGHGFREHSVSLGFGVVFLNQEVFEPTSCSSRTVHGRICDVFVDNCCHIPHNRQRLRFGVVSCLKTHRFSLSSCDIFLRYSNVSLNNR